MITPEPPAGSEHYREGWRHGYEQAAIDRERSADAVSLVPDTGPREALATVRAIWGQGAPEAKAALREQPPRWPELCAALDVLAGLVPDTGQTREQILQRDITFGEYVIAVCDAIGLPHDSPRAAVVEAIRAAVAAAQAPESPTDTTPKAGRGGSSDTETTTGAVQTPDAADLAYARSEVDKWLADNDPYCILPTRTKHIPALLARLDELEGTR